MFYAKLTRLLTLLGESISTSSVADCCCYGSVFQHLRFKTTLPMAQNIWLLDVVESFAAFNSNYLLKTGYFSVENFH
jgi:hypothetical protein